MTVLWIVLGIAYIVLLVSLGMTTLRKGHVALFGFGFIFPLLWIVGAVIEPTNAAATGEARARLQ